MISTKDLEKSFEATLKATLIPYPAPATVNDDINIATSAVRKREEIDVWKAHFTRQVHSTLSLKEQLSIMKEATAGLIVKISKINYEHLGKNSSNDQLKNIIEVETFISKMSVHLLCYDMRTIFTSFLILDKSDQRESDRFQNDNMVNLIQALDTIGPDKMITLKDLADLISLIKNVYNQW